MLRRAIQYVIATVRSIISVVRLRAGVAISSGAQRGQTTAEYALVILGAAAVATLLITWASKSHALGRLFDTVIGKVIP
jgi:uncharacterized protein DUF4244